VWAYAFAYQITSAEAGAAVLQGASVTDGWFDRGAQLCAGCGQLLVRQ